MIFYSCSDDCESLSHECEEDALIEWLESYYDGNDSVEGCCPIQIFKYESKVVTNEVKGNIASLIEEHVLEVWDENYGDPDTYKYETMKNEKEFKEEVLASVNKMMQILGPPWVCELTDTLTFTYNQVVSLLGDEIQEYEQAI